MHVAITVAAAVKDALNAGTFSTDFTAARVAVPQFELSDMNTLHVTVVPRDVSRVMADRNSDEYTVAVDVAIQKRIQVSSEVASVDALLVLVQEIDDYMARRTLGAANDIRWVGAENEPVYAPDHILEQHQFTSVLTLSYKVRR